MPSKDLKPPTFKWHLKVIGPDDGTILLWFHGFMGSLKDWEAEILPHFADFRNIIVDLPGHGHSQMPGRLPLTVLMNTLHEQLHALGIGPLCTIGYSMGGRVALHFQHHFPESVTAMVGISMAPGLETESERQQRQTADDALMDRLETLGFDQFLSEWYALPLFKTFQTNVPDPQESLQRRKANNMEQLRHALRSMGNGALPSLWDTLPLLDIPVLLLNGAEDQKYCNLSQKMLAALKNGRQEIIPETSHALHLEKPVETSRAIGHFLRNVIEGDTRV